MVKYADKYPDPGPRPKAPPAKGPPAPGELVDGLDFTQWRYREQDMTAWQTKCRQRAVALALDDLFADFQRRARSIEGFGRESMRPAERATAAVWLSYLQEPLPEEFFQ